MSITADVITALATAALAVGNFIVISLIFKQIRVQNKQLKIQNTAQLWAFMNQAERDFEELNKLMLTDPLLREVYIGGKDDDYAKKYIFYELYYGYLERTYSFLRDEKINPYQDEEFIKRYWDLYIPTIQWLLRDEPVFRDVHKIEREMQEFDHAFISEVTEIGNRMGIDWKSQV